MGMSQEKAGLEVGLTVVEGLWASQVAEPPCPLPEGAPQDPIHSVLAVSPPCRALEAHWGSTRHCHPHWSFRGLLGRHYVNQLS